MPTQVESLALQAKVGPGQAGFREHQVFQQAGDEETLTVTREGWQGLAIELEGP